MARLAVGAGCSPTACRCRRRTDRITLVPLAFTALAGWRLVRAGVHASRAIGGQRRRARARAGRRGGGRRWTALLGVGGGLARGHGGPLGVARRAGHAGLFAGVRAPGPGAVGHGRAGPGAGPRVLQRAGRGVGRAHRRLCGRPIWRPGPGSRVSRWPCTGATRPRCSPPTAPAGRPGRHHGAVPGLRAERGRLGRGVPARSGLRGRSGHRGQSGQCADRAVARSAGAGRAAVGAVDRSWSDADRASGRGRHLRRHTARPARTRATGRPGWSAAALAGRWRGAGPGGLASASPEGSARTARPSWARRRGVGLFATLVVAVGALVGAGASDPAGPVGSGSNVVDAARRARRSSGCPRPPTCHVPGA